MSYKLFSRKTHIDQGLTQWDLRSIEDELKSFHNRTILDVFNNYLLESSSVLEGGCGLGAWCKWLDMKGHKPTGIEYYPEVVKKAKELDSNVSVELGDVTCLKFPDNSFDAYISLGVIEHFEKGPELALYEAKRILKPGGVAFITTPYLNILRRLFSHIIRDIFFNIICLLGKEKYFWEYRFTKNELTRYIEDAGFEIIYTGIDDYNNNEKNRHIGLWGDFFFLRQTNGSHFELNKLGRIILRIMTILPPSWYCSGIIVVAINKKDNDILPAQSVTDQI